MHVLIMIYENKLYCLYMHVYRKTMSVSLCLCLSLFLSLSCLSLFLSISGFSKLQELCTCIPVFAFCMDNIFCKLWISKFSTTDISNYFMINMMIVNSRFIRYVYLQSIRVYLLLDESNKRIKRYLRMIIHQLKPFLKHIQNSDITIIFLIYLILITLIKSFEGNSHDLICDDKHNIIHVLIL